MRLSLALLMSCAFASLAPAQQRTWVVGGSSGLTLADAFNLTGHGDRILVAGDEVIDLIPLPRLTKAVSIEGIGSRRPRIRLRCSDLNIDVNGSTLPVSLRNLAIELTSADCSGCARASGIALAARNVFIEAVDLVLPSENELNEFPFRGFLDVSAAERAFFQDVTCQSSGSGSQRAICFCYAQPWPTSVRVAARDVVMERCRLVGNSAPETRSEDGCSRALDGSAALRLISPASVVLVDVELVDGLGGAFTTLGQAAATGQPGVSSFAGPGASWNSARRASPSSPPTTIGMVGPNLQADVSSIGGGFWNVSAFAPGSTTVGLLLGLDMFTPIATPLGTLLVNPVFGVSGNVLNLSVPISTSLIGQRFGVQSVEQGLLLGPASWSAL